jgi:hypothetical protein
MSRKPRAYSSEALGVRAVFQAHLAATQTSANAFAKKCGVSQSTISRFLGGTTKTVTPAVRSALSYAGIQAENCIKGTIPHIDNPKVREALERSWDGSPESVEILVALLRALGPVVQMIRASSAGSTP